MAPGELLAPRRACVDEGAVRRAGQFHDRQGGLLLVELRLAGVAKGDQAVQFGLGPLVVGLRLPGEIGVLDREQLQVAHGVENLVAG